MAQSTRRRFLGAGRSMRCGLISVESPPADCFKTALWLIPLDRLQNYRPSSEFPSRCCMRCSTVPTNRSFTASRRPVSRWPIGRVVEHFRRPWDATQRESGQLRPHEHHLNVVGDRRSPPANASLSRSRRHWANQGAWLQVRRFGIPLTVAVFRQFGGPTVRSGDPEYFSHVQHSSRSPTPNPCHKRHEPEHLGG